MPGTNGFFLTFDFKQKKIKRERKEVSVTQYLIQFALSLISKTRLVC